jgi:hypothetical protein
VACTRTLRLTISFETRETLLAMLNLLPGDDETDSDDLDIGKAVRRNIVDLDSYVDCPSFIHLIVKLV